MSTLRAWSARRRDAPRTLCPSHRHLSAQKRGGLQDGPSGGGPAYQARIRLQKKVRIRHFDVPDASMGAPPSVASTLPSAYQLRLMEARGDPSDQEEAMHST